MPKQVPMTADEIGELLGPVAAGWPALGLSVYRLPSDPIAAHRETQEGARS